MEQTKESRHGSGGISESAIDGDQSTVNFTTKPSKIRPRFSIDDVDRHFLNFNYLGRITKRVRIIAWLHLCAMNGYTATRFDALKIGCSIFNTTTSEIGLKVGLRLERRDTSRRTRFSDSTHVCVYWFNVAELPAVEGFLGEFRDQEPD